MLPSFILIKCRVLYMMNIVTIIGVIFTVLVGCISWKEYIKKQEIEALGNHISADFYLKECFNNDSNSLWYKDNLAQKFTRILNMSHILNNRLIELHENNLLNYNNLIKKYRYGYSQIRFIKSDHVSFIRDIQFSPMLKSSYKSEKFVLGFMFILGALLLFISIYEISKISLQNKELNFLELFNITGIFLEGIMIIYVTLYFKRATENAYLFVKLLHEAEIKFLRIKEPKKVKKPS